MKISRFALLALVLATLPAFASDPVECRVSGDLCKEYNGTKKICAPANFSFDFDAAEIRVNFQMQDRRALLTRPTKLKVTQRESLAFSAQDLDNDHYLTVQATWPNYSQFDGTIVYEEDFAFDVSCSRTAAIGLE